MCVYVLFHSLSLGGDTPPTSDHFSVFDVCGLIQWFSEIISMLVMSRYFVYGYFPAFNIVPEMMQFDIQELSPGAIFIFSCHLQCSTIIFIYFAMHLRFRCLFYESMIL